MTAHFRKPHQLLNELVITEPEEIDLEVIAQHVGALVVREPLEGTEARLVGTGDTAIITINSNSGLPRQRFSIGHELGHWMNDRGRLTFECSSRVQTAAFYGTDPESLANAFATALLLPTFMFQPRLGRRAPTLETTKDLAGIFSTSVTATASRIVELSAWPTMLVCSSRDKRVWFKASKDVEGKLWPHDHLDPGTLAFRLLRESGPREATEELDADAWINRPDAGDYVLVESCFRITSDLAISLLWWKDQAQLNDLDEESGD